tara:strand:- start:4934 stop:5047 length:114 start_codon:yes stop_codon:yes gene_type:complete
MKKKLTEKDKNEVNAMVFKILLGIIIVLTIVFIIAKV